MRKIMLRNQDARCFLTVIVAVVMVSLSQAGVYGAGEYAPNSNVKPVDVEVVKENGSGSHPLTRSNGVKAAILAEGFGVVSGLARDSGTGKIYIADSEASSIWLLGPGNQLSEYISGPEPETDASGKQLIHVLAPQGIELDNSGRLVVCDPGERSIRRRESRYKWKDLAVRFGDLTFSNPAGIVMAPDGNFYFSDSRPAAGTDADASGSVPALYRRAKNGRISRIYDGLTNPSSPALSEDGTALFVCNADESNPGVYRFSLGEGGKIGDAIPWPAPQGVASLWTSAPSVISQAGSKCLAVASGNRLTILTEDGVVAGHINFDHPVTSLEYSAGDGVLLAGVSQAVYEIRPVEP